MPVGPFRPQTVPVNLRDLDRFDAGDVVTPEALVEKRLIKNTKIDVKLPGSGEISKKPTVRVPGRPATAREKTEAAGGTRDATARGRESGGRAAAATSANIGAGV